MLWVDAVVPDAIDQQRRVADTTPKYGGSDLGCSRHKICQSATQYEQMQ